MYSKVAHWVQTRDKLTLTVRQVAEAVQSLVDQGRLACKRREGSAQVHITEYQNKKAGLPGKVWAARALKQRKRNAGDAGDDRAPKRSFDSARIEQLEEMLESVRRGVAQREVELTRELASTRELHTVELARVAAQHRIADDRYTALTRALVAGIVVETPAVAGIQPCTPHGVDAVARACEGALRHHVERTMVGLELEEAVVATVASVARALRLTAPWCPGVWLERDQQGGLVYSHSVDSPVQCVTVYLKQNVATVTEAASPEAVGARALGQAMLRVLVGLDPDALRERVRSDLARDFFGVPEAGEH